jgi:hypothetical protein
MLSEQKKEDLESEVRRSVCLQLKKGGLDADDDDDKAGGREWRTSYESGENQRNRVASGMQCSFPFRVLFLINFIVGESSGRVRNSHCRGGAGRYRGQAYTWG